MMKFLVENDWKWRESKVFFEEKRKMFFLKKKNEKCFFWGEKSEIFFWGEKMGKCFFWGEKMGILQFPGDGLKEWVISFLHPSHVGEVGDVP